jgi:hypothetical protein
MAGLVLTVGAQKTYPPPRVITGVRRHRRSGGQSLTRIVLLAARQAALPPFFLHAERKVLRALPCRPFAFAWSEHAFETAFLASEVGLAAGAGCVAADFVVGAGCAMVALAPIRTMNADNIKVFENPITTSLNAGAARLPCQHCSTAAATARAPGKAKLRLGTPAGQGLSVVQLVALIAGPTDAERGSESSDRAFEPAGNRRRFIHTRASLLSNGRTLPAFRPSRHYALSAARSSSNSA